MDIINHVQFPFDEYLFHILTSWSKMDARFSAPLDLSAIKDILDMMDPDIKEIVMQLDGKQPKDVVEELMARADAKILRETRIMIFRAAMDRIDLCLTQVIQARENRTFDDQDRDDAIVRKAEKLFKSLTPHDLINRRCVKKLVCDMMDLLYFVAGQNVRFPMSMLKDAMLNQIKSTPYGDERYFTFEYTQVEISDCMRVMELDCVTSMREDEGDFCGEETTEYAKNGVDMRMEADSSGEQACIKEIDESVKAKNRCNEAIEENVVYRELESTAPIEASWMLSSHENGERDQKDQTRYCVYDIDSQVVERGHSGCMESDSRGEGLNTIPIRNGVSPLSVDERLTELNTSIISCNAIPDECLTRDDLLERASATVYVDEVTSQLLDVRDAPTIHRTRPRGDTAEYTHTSPTRASKRIPRKRPRLQTRKRTRYTPKSDCVCDSVIRLLDRMAQRPLYERNAQGRKRASGECNQRCAALEDWKEDYVRRSGETEDMLIRKLNELRIQNNRLNDEMRDVKRKLSDMSRQRPIIVAPVDSDAIQSGFLNGGGTAGEDIPVSTARRIPYDMAMGNDADASRPRAATHDGPPRRGMRHIVEADRRGKPSTKPPKNNVKAKPPPDPLPQRPPNTRGRRRKGGQVGMKEDVQAITPLSDWLATARPADTAPDATPDKRPEQPEDATSPSWADQDDDDFDSDAVSVVTSIASSPDRPMQQQPVRDDEIDDVYKLPPSGQTTSRDNRASSGGHATSRDNEPRNPRRNDAGSSGYGQRTTRQSTSRDNGTRGNQQNGAGNGGFNGARPKTLGKNGSGTNRENRPGNKSNNKGNDGSGNNPSGGSGKNGVSFAKIVTKNGWKTPMNKKRKFDKVSPKPAPSLKGKASTRNRDIYVQGLDLDEYNDKDELIESVRNHCLVNGIKPIYIHLIPVKFDCTRTGCRVTVRECEFDRVVEDDFWPEDVSAREWTPKPRDQQGNDGDEFRRETDEESD